MRRSETSESEYRFSEHGEHAGERIGRADRADYVDAGVESEGSAEEGRGGHANGGEKGQESRVDEDEDFWGKGGGYGREVEVTADAVTEGECRYCILIPLL